MEYILSAMLLHNSVSRPSQISDKGDMGPTVDYRIFPRIFSSENQKNFSGLKTHRDKVIDNIVF